jgi:hypothetical protein
MISFFVITHYYHQQIHPQEHLKQLAEKEVHGKEISQITGSVLRHGRQKHSLPTMGKLFIITIS